LAYTSPSASVNLRTAYENFRWISLSDARDVIESYGFKFVYHEVSEPLALEVLQKGTKLREIDALSRHTATMENVSVLRSRFEYVLPYQSVISLLEGIRTTTSIVGRNGGPPLVTTGPSPKQRTQRTAQQIVFRRTDNAPDALWKRKIWSGASHSSAAYGPQSVQHRKNRRNYIPEWLIAQARTITNYAPDPGIGLQQYGFTAEVQLNPPDQLAANAWPNLALYLDFEATNDRERDEYEKWAEWYLTEKTPLLGQVINSAGVATANHVYFSPDHLWSFAPDHWRSTAATLSWCQSSRQFDAAGADVARTPWVFNEATWTARKVALSAGNTILKAVDATTDAQQTASSMAGSRFVVLFDIANNFTDLT
jgi:hypothetical protein